MRKEKIDSLIPRAIEVLKEKKIVDENNVIPNEFNGYISSFGASIIQSGLLPSIAFYQNDQHEAKQSRSLLMEAILELIAPQSKYHSLLEYVIDSSEKDTRLKEKIKNATVALKLAMRTYKLDKTGDQNE